MLVLQNIKLEITTNYLFPVDLRQKGLIIDVDTKETEEDDINNNGVSRRKLKFNEKAVIIKKKNKSTKYTLNFKDDSQNERENGNEQEALKWFERFNNRQPNKSEIEQIKAFVPADAENVVDID